MQLKRKQWTYLIAYKYLQPYCLIMTKVEKDQKFISLHDDPNMVWSCFKKGSICHQCLNYITDEDGGEFCDVRCIDPEDMTIEELEEVQRTNKCEYFIKKN